MKRKTLNVWASGFTASAAISAFMDRMSPATIAVLVVISLLNWNASACRD